LTDLWQDECICTIAEGKYLLWNAAKIRAGLFVIPVIERQYKNREKTQQQLSNLKR
jgi:hypothetical protein